MFKKFWFEGNEWFKMVNNSNDLLHLIMTYSEICVDITDARECVRKDKSMPLKFGFTSECKGVLTLGEFLDGEC